MHVAPPLKTRPGSKAASFNNEGIEQYNQGNWKNAQKLVTEAVQADPKSAEAYYNLALAFDQTGDHLRATEHFKKAYVLGRTNDDIQTSRILLTHLCSAPN